MAQDPDDDDNDDGTFTKVDKYFAEHGYADEFCGPLSQEPNQDERDLAGIQLQQASSGVQFSGDTSSCRLHRDSNSRGAKYYQPQHAQEGGL